MVRRNNIWCFAQKTWTKTLWSKHWCVRSRLTLLTRARRPYALRNTVQPPQPTAAAPPPNKKASSNSLWPPNRRNPNQPLVWRKRGKDKFQLRQRLQGSLCQLLQGEPLRRQHQPSIRTRKLIIASDKYCQPLKTVLRPLCPRPRNPTSWTPLRPSNPWYPTSYPTSLKMKKFGFMSVATIAIPSDRLWTVRRGRLFWITFCLWPKKKFKRRSTEIWKNTFTEAWGFKSMVGKWFAPDRPRVLPN